MSRCSRFASTLLLVSLPFLALTVPNAIAQDGESWGTYSEDIHSELVASSSEYPGIHFNDNFGSCEVPDLPRTIYDGIWSSGIFDDLSYDIQDFLTADIAVSFGYIPLSAGAACVFFSADYTAEIAPTYAGSMMLIFDSDDEANAVYAEVSNGLIRTGWQSHEVDGLDHDYTCVTLVIQGATLIVSPTVIFSPTLALCGVTRGDTLLIGATILPVQATEAALQDAADLAQMMNGAYDEVDRPD